MVPLFYQNTKIQYFDDALKGIEAQKKDLAKAEKFIFMEYHAIEDAESWHAIRDILGFVQPYADSPLNKKRIGEDVYICMAEGAQEYVWYITPYLIIIVGYLLTVLYA